MNADPKAGFGEVSRDGTNGFLSRLLADAERARAVAKIGVRQAVQIVLPKLTIARRCTNRLWPLSDD